MPHVVNWQDRQLVKDERGRVTGAVVNGRFYRRVQGSKHMLRSPRAWTVNAAALSIARTLGAVGVTIEDEETGKVYAADLVTIDAHGYRFNRGWDEQIALPLPYWQIEGSDKSNLPVQAALFA